MIAQFQKYKISYMKINLIIADFESAFSSSFKHTARTQFDIDFNSSIIQDIIDKLNLLKKKIEAGEVKNIHVGWQMDINHVNLIEQRLNQILNHYEEFFNYRPLIQKIYSVNSKLIELEIPNPKDFAQNVIKDLLAPAGKVKKSKKEVQHHETFTLSLTRALKANKKL